MFILQLIIVSFMLGILFNIQNRFYLSLYFLWVYGVFLVADAFYIKVLGELL